MHSVMPENEATNEGRAENFLHRTDGGSVSQGPELTARLATLIKHLVQRV